MSEITINQGNLMERKNCTQCKKIVISKIVINWTSLTLRRTMGTLTSNISGIPDEAVKRSENFNILQLIRKITRHPQQEAVQNDLDKQQSFNAFSDESKNAIMDAGNIEISEIVNAEPKWQCKVCLNHCSTGVIYCVCGRLMTKDSAENRKKISAILDTFSIPNFERTDHVVTGMENHRDAKNTLRRINLQRNAVKRSTTASTTGSSATRPSERR